MSQILLELTFIIACSAIGYCLLLKRDLFQLDRTLTGLINEKRLVSNNGLNFRAPKRISSSIAMLAAAYTKKMLEEPVSEKIIKVNEEIYFSGESCEEICRRILKAIKKEIGPSLRAGAISINPKGENLQKLDAIFGLPKERLESQILILMENSANGIPEPENVLNIFNICGRYTNIYRGRVTVGLYLGFEAESQIDLFLLKGVWKRITMTLQNMGQVGLQMDRLGEDRDYLLGLSHDLRAPIASALYANHSLREKFGNTEEIESIEYAINEQLLLVNNTLDLANTDSKLLVSKAVNFKLKNEIDIVLAKLKWMSNEYGVLLETNLDHKSTVYFDREQFQRIIQNYLCNAIKHSESKTICISERPLGNEQTEISIFDYGKGIDKHLESTLFEKPRKKGNVDGFGLGLYVCSVLAKANGGSTFYRKNTPKGSIFGLRVLSSS